MNGRMVHGACEVNKVVEHRSSHVVQDAVRETSKGQTCSKVCCSVQACV